MVNRKRNFTLHFYLMAALTTLALGAVNYLGMEYRTRIDLTGDQRFTLSEGTQRLFEKLPEPITVTYYVDEEPPAKRINLERDVRDKLEELASSSGGKLEYAVERISNQDASEKRKELEKKGITDTVDVLTSGTDERAEMRGVQGYFSSIEIKYGLADPKVINGVVNLVDKTDEVREHRVDTLEFDIAYTVLTMRNDTRRPSFERLLRTMDGPLQVGFFVTKDMPEQFNELKSTVVTGVNSFSKAGGKNVVLVTNEISNDTMKELVQPNPFVNDAASGIRIMPFGQGGRRMQVQTPDGPMVLPSEIYTACVYLRFKTNDGLQENMIGDFTEAQSADEVKTKIEDMVWETFRPRTRLGFVLPPHDPRYGPQQPGQPPGNGHMALMNYIQSALAYDTIFVDLKTDKRVPRDLACLIVLEANLLTERELYEVERYLNEGGNVVMLVQGWDAQLELSPLSGDEVKLEPQDMDPAFKEWAQHLGIKFEQDLLLRKNATLQPWQMSIDQGRQRMTPYPSSIKFAPVVEPQDLNQASVFTRGLAAMPLPLVVEETVDDDRLRELGLKKTELIRLKDEVYKFIPANPVMPGVPLNLNLNLPAEVENQPDAKPGEEVGAQKLGHEPLIAALLTGKFPSFWVDDGRKVPGWNGDPTEDDAVPVVNPKEGNLLVMSTAATLNIDYFYGYTEQARQRVVIPRGLNFYRNVSEAFIYGEDLVSLRARTGVAPRIVGPIEDSTKAMWFMICIAGVPVLLLLLTGARSFAHAREREDYEIGLGIRETKKSD
ncbi:MAG: Gldg family protein [Planctomycetota bacterium]